MKEQKVEEFKPMFTGHKPSWYGKFFKVPESKGVTIYLYRGNNRR